MSKICYFFLIYFLPRAIHSLKCHSYDAEKPSYDLSIRFSRVVECGSLEKSCVSVYNTNDGKFIKNNRNLLLLGCEIEILSRLFKKGYLLQEFSNGLCNTSEVQRDKVMQNFTIECCSFNHCNNYYKIGCYLYNTDMLDRIEYNKTSSSSLYQLDRDFPLDICYYVYVFLDYETLSFRHFSMKGASFEKHIKSLHYGHKLFWKVLSNKIRSKTTAVEDIGFSFIFSMGTTSQYLNKISDSFMELELELEKSLNSEAKTEQFARNFIKFVKLFNFNGIDIASYYPNMTQVLQLYKLIKSKNASLSTSITLYGKKVLQKHGQWRLDLVIDTPSIKSNFRDGILSHINFLHNISIIDDVLLGYFFQELRIFGKIYGGIGLFANMQNYTIPNDECMRFAFKLREKNLNKEYKQIIDDMNSIIIFNAQNQQNKIVELAKQYNNISVFIEYIKILADKKEFRLHLKSAKTLDGAVIIFLDWDHLPSIRNNKTRLQCEFNEPFLPFIKEINKAFFNRTEFRTMGTINNFDSELQDAIKFENESLHKNADNLGAMSNRQKNNYIWVLLFLFLLFLLLSSYILSIATLLYLYRHKLRKYSSLPRSFQKYKLETNKCKFTERKKELGKGAYGRVLLCDCQPEIADFTMVALKLIKNVYSNADEQAVLSECRILWKMREEQENKNKEQGMRGDNSIVRLLGAVIFKKKIGLVMEYLEGGDLRAHLKGLASQRRERNSYAETSSTNQQNSLLEAEEMIPLMNENSPALSIALEWLFCIANAMEFMHFRSYVHRDIASRNCIFVDEMRRKLKLGDFGKARETNSYSGGAKTRSAHKNPENADLAWRWMAPEILEDDWEGHFSKSADVWSFGVLIWEICELSDSPYGEISNRRKEIGHFLLKEKKTLEFRRRAPELESLREMAAQCWKIAPKERPKFREIKTEIENKLQKIADAAAQLKCPPQSSVSCTSSSALLASQPSTSSAIGRNTTTTESSF